MSHICRHIKYLKVSMVTFEGSKPATILYFFSQFVEECKLERISEVQACLIVPSFMKRKALHHSFMSRNNHSCTRLCYWRVYVNSCHFFYATNAFISGIFMQIKGIKQLPTKTGIKMSPQVNKITFRRNSAWSLENTIPTFVFRLQ